MAALPKKLLNPKKIKLSDNAAWKSDRNEIKAGRDRGGIERAEENIGIKNITHITRKNLMDKVKPSRFDEEAFNTHFADKSVYGMSEKQALARGNKIANMDNKSYKYKQKQQQTRMKDFDNVIKSNKELSTEEIDKLANHNRLTDQAKQDAFKTSMSAKDYSSAKTILESNAGSFRANVSGWDTAVAHKVPHMAGGGLVTVGVVSAMSTNKGQMHNSQLYNPNAPYY